MWIFLVLVRLIICQFLRAPFVTSQTNPSNDIATTLAPSAPESIEILKIFQPPGVGNGVKLVWGREFEKLKLNVTYGVHYGTDEENISDPRLITKNSSAVIEDLEYCTKYNFAVTVLDNHNNGEHSINPNTIRSIITFLDPDAPPQDLQVEYEPLETPCLLVKWSASCPNVGQPIGYVISALEHQSTDYKIVTLPASKRTNFLYHFKVNYGDRYDIKVSTNFPGSKATDIVTYKVPGFLQPYKVRISANAEEGAFMIYWAEPFVPYYVNKVYYEVHIHKGSNVSNIYEKYYVTRPVLIYKGDGSQYTFTVGSISYDDQYRSIHTEPLVADIFGDVHELNKENKI